jgi:hypothetical protein
VIANCGVLTISPGSSTSNSLSCSWVTTSSGCQVSPMNGAAVSIVDINYAVSTTASTVTVNHTALSGSTSAKFSIACSQQ